MARTAFRGPTLPTFGTLLVLIAACTGDGLGPAIGSPAANANPGGSGSVADCPSVELRGPDGTAPDLGGTWVGIAERGALPTPGRYEFNLLNSCLAWVGRSNEEGEDVGASWMNVFIGNVNSDFTISGDWAIVSTGGSYCRGIAGPAGALCDKARGTLTLRIEWVETAEGDKVRLVLEQLTKVGDALAGVGEGQFTTGIWVRPGDEALFDVPVD